MSALAGETDGCSEPPPELLRHGIELFNQGRFFEQHEVLEELWRAERRPVRRLYQGILQVGVAFHHLRRLNFHGVTYMLARGQMYLAPFVPACQRVDVARLIRDAARAEATVVALGPDRLGEFDWSQTPRVVLLSDR